MTADMNVATHMNVGTQKEETLWEHQVNVRNMTKALRSCLVYEVEAKEAEALRPMVSKIEDMIDYEIVTWNILKEILATAKRLGKE